jgi:hypothetical protein
MPATLDPLGATDPASFVGLRYVVNDYLVLWHGVAMRRGIVLMLSAGHDCPIRWPL